MIFTYNLEHVGDVLMVTVAPHKQGDEVSASRVGDVAVVKSADGSQVLGVNIFEVSAKLGAIDGRGQITLSDDQVATLNALVTEAGFDFAIVNDASPKLVVGLVETCEEHPDSDHLHVCRVRGFDGEELQIVCGAPNVEAGARVVLARGGKVMPNGLIIWPGALRGVESNGMLCSARELEIAGAPDVRGILLLDSSYEVGAEFVPADYKF
jgi:tRNA-binding protein